MGSVEMVGETRQEREESDRLPLGGAGVEGAAMAASLESLGGDAAIFHPGHDGFREQSHDRGDHRWREIDEDVDPNTAGNGGRGGHGVMRFPAEMSSVPRLP